MIRISRFVVVGAGANLLLFVLVYSFRHFGMPAFAAGVAAYAIAFVAAYSAQYGWTFRSARSHRDTFPRYLAAQCGCAIVSGFVGFVCIELLALPTLGMSAAVTATAGVTSYLLSSRWVFVENLTARRR